MLSTWLRDPSTRGFYPLRPCPMQRRRPETAVPLTWDEKLRPCSSSLQRCFFCWRSVVFYAPPRTRRLKGPTGLVQWGLLWRAGSFRDSGRSLGSSPSSWG